MCVQAFASAVWTNALKRKHLCMQKEKEASRLHITHSTNGGRTHGLDHPAYTMPDLVGRTPDRSYCACAPCFSVLTLLLTPFRLNPKHNSCRC